MIAVLVFFAVFAVLGGRYWLAMHQLNALAERIDGRRLLGQGHHAVETDDAVIEVIQLGVRVEVNRVRLGRRTTLTLQPGSEALPAAIRTGFSEVDRNFRLTGDDRDLAAAVFADPKVREALLLLQTTLSLRRIDLTAAEKLVVVGRPRRHHGEKAAVGAVVALARALDEVRDVKAGVGAGADLAGGVGAHSGAPFAMPVGR